MEMCCRGRVEGCGAVCPKAGTMRPRMTRKARSVGRAKVNLCTFAHTVRLGIVDRVGKDASRNAPERPHRAGDASLPILCHVLRGAKTLIIDHYAPWNATDRNRNRGL